MRLISVDETVVDETVVDVAAIKTQCFLTGLFLVTFEVRYLEDIKYIIVT